MFHQDMRAPCARPFIKWPGGKSAELSVLAPYMPTAPARYLEPFLGGGALLMAISPKTPALANDASEDLVDLYRHVANRAALPIAQALASLWSELMAMELAGGADGILAELAPIIERFAVGDGPLWPVPDGIPGYVARELARKAAFMAKHDIDPQTRSILLTAVLGGAYYAFRSLAHQLNPGPLRAVLFWAVRDFCYGAMHRTNGSGAFNVAYGGASYNGRGFAGRAAQAAAPEVQERLRNTVLHQGDFETFLDGAQTTSDDLVFLDPPYDSNFSNYDGRGFSQDDHLRLADWMARSPARCVLVISDTTFVRQTYLQPGMQVDSFSKRYRYGIKGRFDQAATHLVIRSNIQHDERIAA